MGVQEWLQKDGGGRWRRTKGRKEQGKRGNLGRDSMFANWNSEVFLRKFTTIDEDSRLITFMECTSVMVVYNLKKILLFLFLFF